MNHYSAKPKRLQEGSSQLVVYLYEVNEVEVERLMEIFADTLVERGYARDEECRAILAVQAWEWPPDTEEFIRKVAAEAAVILIPREPEQGPA